MENSSEPKLAPPGAGLPAYELRTARVLFALQRKRGNRATFNAAFGRERRRIASLVESCPPELAGVRVLIARPRGLEDSSRFWSVWMTLDHLRIVHEAMAGVVRSLGQGIMPPGEASTAAVKPSPNASSAVLPLYEKSCDDLLAAVASVPSLETPLRYPHLWFGPLDAAGWHALAAGHLRIHRVQLERILLALPSLSSTLQQQPLTASAS